MIDYIVDRYKFTKAWACYLTGNSISYIMNTGIDGGMLYPIYNWLMVTSSELDHEGDFGIWETEVLTEEEQAELDQIINSPNGDDK